MASAHHIFSEKPDGRGWRVGLTGSMGAGKSMVLAMFEKAGWLVVNADEVVRELLQSDPETKRELVARWGSQVLRASGEVDRAYLGRVVFSDSVELKHLESILHPRVHATWSGQMKGAGAQNAIAEIPLLFEKELQHHFDWTVCLAISEARQLDRLAGRGMDTEAAHARIAQQLTTCEKVKRADIVLSNEGSERFLQYQLDTLLCLCGAISQPFEPVSKHSYD